MGSSPVGNRGGRGLSLRRLRPGVAWRHPGSPSATALPLAEDHSSLQSICHDWLTVAREFDEIDAPGSEAPRELESMGWALGLNCLKIRALEADPPMVRQALQVTGILAFKSDTTQRGRHHRDVLSASLVVSNARMEAKDASTLLIFEEN